MSRTACITRGVVSAVLLVSAYGWLDLLRHLPGPHLPLVLPLRGNGRADDVSLVTVIVVMTAAFAAIARISPPRATRLARAMVVRAALCAAFIVFVVALQQGIVEQSQPSFSWGSALWLVWPWLATACAALGTYLGAPRARAVATWHAPLPPRVTEPIGASETRPLEASVQ